MHAPNDSPAAREFASFSSIVLNHTSTISLTCYREVMPRPFALSIYLLGDESV
jgi:hypothetical protein